MKFVKSTSLMINCKMKLYMMTRGCILSNTAVSNKWSSLQYCVHCFLYGKFVGNSPQRLFCYSAEKCFMIQAVKCLLWYINILWCIFFYLGTFVYGPTFMLSASFFYFKHILFCFLDDHRYFVISFWTNIWIWHTYYSKKYNSVQYSEKNKMGFYPFFSI